MNARSREPAGDHNASRFNQNIAWVFILSLAKTQPTPAYKSSKRNNWTKISQPVSILLKGKSPWPQSFAKRNSTTNKVNKIEKKKNYNKQQWYLWLVKRKKVLELLEI